MPIQWTWDISFGQIILAMPMSLIVLALFKIFRILLLFRMEHEMLMQEWATRQPQPFQLSDLHTRKKFWW